MITTETHPVGRELDEQVLIAFFGWRKDGRFLRPPDGDPKLGWAAEWDEHGRPDWMPEPSNNDAQAFEIAAKLREEGWLVVMKWMPKEFYYIMQGSRSEYDHPHPDQKWGKGKVVVELEWMRNIQGKARRMVLVSLVSADTLAHAMCIAGLRAGEALENAK